MAITITVARSAPEAAYRRVVELTRLLQQTDSNFKGVKLEVRRDELKAGAFEISDGDDQMRERLLQLLVSDAMKDEENSVLGGLCG
jgi:hypothetical protein